MKISSSAWEVVSVSKFHVNDEGNVGRCTAEPGKCRFGSESDHSSSKEEARAKAEERLAAEYGSLGFSKIKKRPIDRLVDLFAMKPLKRELELRDPIPDHFKISKGLTKDKPESFDTFVSSVEAANEESRVDRTLSQAAWDFNRDRIFNREIPVVDDSFKSFYTDARIENSNLTLQNWGPDNSTQDYVVKELVSNTLAQHSLRLEEEGINDDPFYKSFSVKNSIERVDTHRANSQLQTVSEFSNGWVYGIIDATERAKKYKFSEVDTDAERKLQLIKFIEEEAALAEMSYQDDKSDFNDGRALFFQEWVNEES
jgi:hypothetical protein